MATVDAGEAVRRWGFDRDALAESLRAAGARFAFVFGSSVDPERTAPPRDLDVAVWTGRTDVDSLAARGHLPETVNVVVLDRAPLELAGRVALHGELLFDDEPARRVRWQADVRKRYLDEQPRLAAARRDFAAAHRQDR